LIPAEGDVETVQHRLRQRILPFFHAYGWDLTL
jgi:hypothetical protein